MNKVASCSHFFYPSFHLQGFTLEVMMVTHLYVTSKLGTGIKNITRGKMQVKG